jgi:hypothetical protein
MPSKDRSGRFGINNPKFHRLLRSECQIVTVRKIVKDMAVPWLGISNLCLNAPVETSQSRTMPPEVAVITLLSGEKAADMSA